MKKVLSWIAKGFAALATVVLFLAVGAFAASELMYRKGAPKPQAQLASAAKGPDAVARGRRVAVLNGCHDCHGADLAGMLFHDDGLFRGYGPNLTRIAAKQSDAQLDAAIRHGVSGDGRALWVMPSEAFSELTDAEAADLLAYIRSFPVKGEDQPKSEMRLPARLGIVLGKFHSAPQSLRINADRFRPDVGPEHTKGRDVARLCTECHAKDLKGRPELKAPDLEIAAAYAPADFAKLLRTGVPPTGKDLRLMSGVAKSRFSALTDEEIAALHGYLQARSEKGL